MTQKYWQQDLYYKKAHEASLSTDYLGLVVLRKYAKNAIKILDFGCGEGTKLAQVLGSGQKGYGIDVSKKAIELAKKQYSTIPFTLYNGKVLPYKDKYFDLVFSSFTLEHINSPEAILREMIRVVKKSGCLVIMAPNFGSPNRASPPYNKSRIIKLINGFVSDLLSKSKELNWENIKPVSGRKYEMDFDTTVEPYIRTLMAFLSSNKMAIKFWSVGWQYELENAKIHQRLFRLLASYKIYPFIYWGPHIILVCQKNG